LVEQTSIDQVESIWVDASVALDTALAPTSTSLPSPSFAGLFANDQHLADEVV
jgi:hypothetical protein